MTEASDQANARARLAWICHVLRPDWDMPGIERAIEKAAEKGTLGEVCRSAIDAAMTATTKTPAGIPARVRDGWTSGAIQERPIQHFTGPVAVQCPIRGHGFHAGEPCDGKPYKPPSPDTIRAAREAAASAVLHPSVVAEVVERSEDEEVAA